MSLSKVRDDAYDILLPAAQKFQKEVIQKQEPYALITKHTACRIKFVSKKWEKEWQKHCKENNLPNEATIDY